MSWSNREREAARWRQRANRKRRLWQSFRPRVEALEDRRMLAVILNSTSWTPLGPAPVNTTDPLQNGAVAGRVMVMAADPLNVNVVYLATDNGGVFKTINWQTATPTWTAVTDDQPSPSVGGFLSDGYRPMAVSAKNSQVVYAAVSGPGGGILASSDAGKTWVERGNSTFDLAQFRALAISPTDPQTLYVAVRAGASAGPGVYRSIDGGATWANLTSAIPAAASDIVIDPKDAKILYTGLFGGAGGINGIYKSIDSGGTWTQLTTGILSGANVGPVIRLAISPTTTADLYVTIFDLSLINAQTAPFGLPRRYKTTDGGTTFTALAAVPGQDDPFVQEAVLAVDPTNPMIVYTNSFGFVLRSTDAGATWASIFAERAVGGYFDAGGKFVVVGLRGVYQWGGPGTTFANKVGNLTNTEFFTIAVDPTTNIYGFALDQFSAVKFTGNLAWDYTGTFDPIPQLGKFIVTPNNAKRVYAYAALDATDLVFRSDDSGATWTAKSTGIVNNSPGVNQAVASYRAFTMDPSNVHRLLVGTSRVFETINDGDAWAPISSATDLSPGQFVTAVAIAPSQKNTVYAATADGKFFVTNDDGLTAWQERDTGLPINAAAHVLSVAIDPKDPLHLFAIVGELLNGFVDNKHVFTTTNGGTSWTNITGNLPLESVPQSMAVDWSGTTPVLCVGTLRGIYSSTDVGATWATFGTKLPNTAVTDLQFQSPLSKRLFAATYGRGVWGIVATNTPPPTISITDVSVLEGTSGTTNATFTVTLSAAASVQVTVDFATADGTGVTGEDYIAKSGTLTFNPGVTSQTIDVAVVGDTVFDPDETFTVNLTNPVNATIVKPTGTGTILDVDNSTGPKLTINDVSKNEGDSGTTSFTFTVTLSIASAQTVTVNFATADGTATAGSDYVSQTGALTFAPGETTKTITVLVNGDTIVELDETFFVNLTTPVNASILRPQGVGTIVNDDGLPKLSITDVAQKEGNSGTTSFIFTVTLAGASATTVNVDFATADGTANAGSDYIAQSGTLSFAPGTTSQTITVSVIGDRTFEQDETFFVNLSATSGVILLKDQGVGTILDDDATILPLYVGDVTVTASASGQTSAVFPVALTGPSNVGVTVHYATADGSAIAGADYIAQSGTLSFAPGEITKFVTVPILQEAAGGPTKTFTISLSNPVNATLGDGQGIGTIVAPPPVSPDQIIDDGASGYSQLGTWTAQSNSLAYQLDYHLAAKGNGDSQATWTFSGVAIGQYQVQAHWIPFSAWASNAPFTIFDGTSNLGTVRVNQQQSPSGVIVDGVTWASLGTFNVSSGTLKVTLSNNADGSVVADAIRLVPAGAATAAQLSLTGKGHAIANNDVSPSTADGTDFGSIVVGTATAVQTFIISNGGNAALNLTGNPIVQISGPGASAFAVTVAPTAVVGVGASTTLQITFAPQELGLHQATITIANDSGQNPFTFAIQGTAVSTPVITSPWQNPNNPLDVNNDGATTALDALVLINGLNAGLGGPLPANPTPPPYYDTNGDGMLSPLDVLVVINSLNAKSKAASAAAPSAVALSASPGIAAGDAQGTLAVALGPAPAAPASVAPAPAASDNSPSPAAGSAGKQAASDASAAAAASAVAASADHAAWDPQMAELDGILADIAGDLAGNWKASNLGG